ncbi:hypothetical protein PCANC_20486 [Puccinia coronata f. sp. avenae]|uniref:Uncharacterized protein n=1 Tax=Puccinia coronata f. sp. avenae TaxID=200324 RepID=A0A2N5U981_9BASI|nr:hypothetical protein PCANC_20486 [Puccinia coronata f. sp. avenae]PLW34305.1 hypothetical protein PCASD_17273 [Puccinia coronata f. sp. avenae]
MAKNSPPWPYFPKTIWLAQKPLQALKGVKPDNTFKAEQNIITQATAEKALEKGSFSNT